MKYYVVTYQGPFGFIKPWTAVRDGETFSQQFLTPSIVAGMERKLFPELLDKPFGHYAICRHRLRYDQMDAQQEVIQTRGWNFKKNSAKRPRSILIRSVLLNPVLHLAFEEEEYAERASQQHLCLCRNEDIVYPGALVEVYSSDFDDDQGNYNGFELLFSSKYPQSFMVGHNRYDNGAPMYGDLRVFGEPVNTY